MKKPAAALIMALLITAAAGTLLVKLGKANPYSSIEVIAPPVHPEIVIHSPVNNSVYASAAVTIYFNTSIDFGTDFIRLSTVLCNLSWQQESLSIYRWSINDLAIPADDDPWITDFSYKLNLTDIPEGYQTVIINAWAFGSYLDGLVLKTFDTSSSAFVNFLVDITAPAVFVPQGNNETYKEPMFPLNFLVNESVSKISYVLDGQENVTIAGNTTLTGISNGMHNVTVYAWDSAGNVGASETVTFTVAEPESFPTVPVAAVSAASIAAVIAAGLLLIRRRRKEATQP